MCNWNFSDKFIYPDAVSLKFKSLRCRVSNPGAGFIVDQQVLFAGIQFVLTWGSCCFSHRSKQPHICQGHPHLLLHSAWFTSVLYQSQWQCLCPLSCYWSLPHSGCRLSAHFQSGGGDLSTGATLSMTSREGAGKWNVTFEEFDWLLARAPRWTRAAIKQAPLFPLTACSASQSAPCSTREELLWSNFTFHINMRHKRHRDSYFGSILPYFISKKADRSHRDLNKDVCCAKLVHRREKVKQHSFCSEWKIRSGKNVLDFNWRNRISWSCVSLMIIVFLASVDKTISAPSPLACLFGSFLSSHMVFISILSLPLFSIAWHRRPLCRVRLPNWRWVFPRSW